MGRINGNFQMKRDLVGYRFNTQAEFQRVRWTMKRLEDLSYDFWVS